MVLPKDTTTNLSDVWETSQALNPFPSILFLNLQILVFDGIAFHGESLLHFIGMLSSPWLTTGGRRAALIRDISHLLFAMPWMPSRLLKVSLEVRSTLQVCLNIHSHLSSFRIDHQCFEIGRLSQFTAYDLEQWSKFRVRGKILLFKISFDADTYLFVHVAKWRVKWRVKSTMIPSSPFVYNLIHFNCQYNVRMGERNLTVIQPRPSRMTQRLQTVPAMDILW